MKKLLKDKGSVPDINNLSEKEFNIEIEKGIEDLNFDRIVPEQVVKNKANNIINNNILFESISFEVLFYTHF